MNKKPAVLIVEDEKNTREGLERALNRNYNIILADSGERALQILNETTVDILLSDLRMPGMNGLTLSKRALALDPKPVCILLTAYGSIETAVEAMKIGAYDFLTKPVNLDELDLVLQRALRSRQLESENRDLRTQLDEKFGLENIIGKSPAMEVIFDMIRQVAPSRATVLIQGESGTGKELVAHAIHTLSPRAQGPFVVVHCAALPQSLLESELFGHEKGAFTGAVEQRLGRFELAEGGTLFLDEISEIDPAIQVKLLRILEDHRFERVGGQKTLEVDIRLIAATNTDLDSMVGKNKFRQDFFFRLNVVNISLPPLRERLDDIPLLVRDFIREFARENNKTIDDITPDVLDVFMAYSWPGNVRELRNVIERKIVLARSNKLTVRDVPAAIKSDSQGRLSIGGINPPSTIQEANKQMIITALKSTGGNRTRAAKQLGISRRTLHRKLHEFGLINGSGSTAEAKAKDI